jgi:hypothetical protein
MRMVEPMTVVFITVMLLTVVLVVLDPAAGTTGRAVGAGFGGTRFWFIPHDGEISKPLAVSGCFGNPISIALQAPCFQTSAH